MRATLWPQSLFGRLVAASVIAVLLAQAAALLLIAREREHFVLQSSVREWSRRIAETTLMLQPLDAAERGGAVAALQARGPGYGPRHPPPPPGARAARAALRAFLRLPLLSDFEETLKQQLHAAGDRKSVV